MPTADLGDIQIHYRIHGEGPPVLGIMGFALDQRFWAAQVPTVSAHNQFITFDNRGVGRSTGAVATTIDQMADDALRLLDHLEIEKTVVFGVSMGGTIAQRLTLDHPDRVEALILAVTWARPIEFMRRQEALAQQLVQELPREAFIETSMLRMFSPRFFEVGQEVIDRMIRSMFVDSGPELPTDEVVIGQLDAIMKHDTLEDLGHIDVPTLVVGGKLDMMVPSFAAEEIAAAIPGAELAMFATGHGLMVEEMEPFNARLAEFLARIPLR